MLHAWNAAEWNPPLYLIVAWPWAKVFGTGEVGLRSLSAILGVGLVPLLYLCGRELDLQPRRGDRRRAGSGQPVHDRLLA